MSDFTFKQLQKENLAWTDHNFGRKGRDKAYMPLLGMCEELGELVSAVDDDDCVDACADFVIFAADYCNMMGLNLQKIYNSSLVLDPYLEYELCGLLNSIGSIQHHHLKMEQGIRGSEEEHLSLICMHISHILCMLQDYITMYYDSNVSIVQAVEHVWSEVRKRDFTKNKLTGQV